MSSTTKDFKTAASNIRDEAASTAYGVKNDVKGAADKAGNKVTNFLSNASDEISHVSESVTKQINTNPVQSTLIALGIGYVLGALFRR